MIQKTDKIWLAGVQVPLSTCHLSLDSPLICQNDNDSCTLILEMWIEVKKMWKRQKDLNKTKKKSLNGHTKAVTSFNEV